jgi:hypothetical protein|tara:strand:+ start:4909 stop:5097 length:189 start_codon:yes stop_codon:yes gene_type:complete
MIDMSDKELIDRNTWLLGVVYIYMTIWLIATNGLTISPLGLIFLIGLIYTLYKVETIIICWR